MLKRILEQTKSLLAALLSRERSRLVRNSFVLLLFCAMALLFSSPLLAQSCPLCKTALIGQAESILDAINLGILVLLFPPLVLMSSIVIIAFRRDQD